MNTSRDQFYKEIKEFWKCSENTKQSPVDNFFALCPLVLSNCNGTGNWRFNDATLEYAKLEGCTLGYWFNSAKDIVSAELSQKNSTLMNKLQQNAFDQLINFVNELEKHENCLSFICKTESEMCGILALHLFGPLVDGEYKIDGIPSKPKQCCRCRENIKAGDTSFGNKTVWHGKADIMLKNSIVKVNLKEDEDIFPEMYLDGDAERSLPVLSATDMENVYRAGWSKRKVSSQVLAQTIVNAFCCSKLNKSLSNSFIPSFLVEESEVSIYIYNCDQDKLLTSAPLPLWRKGKLDDLTLNINTILYIWIALHFDLFDRNSTVNRLQEYFPSCRFKTIVGNKYQIYKEKMIYSLESSDENFVVRSLNHFLVDPTIQMDENIMKESKRISEWLIEKLESD